MEQDSNLQHPHPEAYSLSDALSNVLSNPEMMEKIRTIAQQLPSDASSSAPPDGLSPASSPKAPSADGLASILADPQLMARLPQMMATLGPMLGSISPPATSHNKQEKPPEACRDDLLLALKPFLSPERCHAIDTMLRISHLGNVFSQLK